jgi:hypothetical protein
MPAAGRQLDPEELDARRLSKLRQAIARLGYQSLSIVMREGTVSHFSGLKLPRLEIELEQMPVTTASADDPKQFREDEPDDPGEPLGDDERIPDLPD